MPVTVVVSSNHWSDSGQIPQIREAMHSELQKRVSELCSAEGATAHSVSVSLRSIVTDVTNEHQIEAMVIQDLTVRAFGDGFGTEEAPEVLFQRKGVLTVIPSAYRGWGSWGRKGTFGRTKQEDETTPVSAKESARVFYESEWDRMSDDEMFAHYYGR